MRGRLERAGWGSDDYIGKQPTRFLAIARGARVAHQRGWKKRRNPTSATAPAASTRAVEMPSMNIVNTPIRTSGKPTPYAGPAAHGELFSGKE
jgi:hypothetical protein